MPGCEHTTFEGIALRKRYSRTDYRITARWKSSDKWLNGWSAKPRLPRLIATPETAPLERARELGPMSPSDTLEERAAKIAALIAVREAAISGGMETWSRDRIHAEVGKLRRRPGRSD